MNKTLFVFSFALLIFSCSKVNQQDLFVKETILKTKTSDTLTPAIRQ